MQLTSLVTGGAGFIGSHVVKHLLDQNHTVIILDDLSGGDKANIHPSALFCEGSILDVELVNSLFEKHNFTYVYHLAAYAAEGLSHFIRNFNYQNNLIGSINLINASVNNKVKRFVFTSSIAVYGTNELPLNEAQNPQPEDPYGIAKYAVEMDLINAQKMFGLDYVIFRPHNVYGTHQNIGDKYRNVVGIFMNQILEGKPLSIFGDGEQTRAFTHIDDVAPYIADSVNVAEARNMIFNIGDDEVTSVKDLACAVARAMASDENDIDHDVDVDLIHLDDREEVVHAYADHSKFRSVFNPKQRVSLPDGLAEMAEWVNDLALQSYATQSGVSQSKAFENIEIEEKLPESWRTKAKE